MNIQNQNYNISGEDYDYLYKKYISGITAMEILTLFGIYDIKGKHIWDICCGANMRSSKEFLINGAAFVQSIDNYEFEPKLYGYEHNTSLGNKFLNNKFHYFFNKGIDSFLSREFLMDKLCNERPMNSEPAPKKPNIIFCQQGMAYIFSPSLICNLISNLSYESGSSLIFNIPRYSSEKRKIMVNSSYTKRYTIDKEEYLENSWINGQEFIENFGNVDILHHTQWCKSKGSHYTKFYYLDDEKIVNLIRELGHSYQKAEIGNSMYLRIFRD